MVAPRTAIAAPGVAWIWASTSRNQLLLGVFDGDRARNLLEMTRIDPGIIPEELSWWKYIFQKKLTISFGGSIPDELWIGVLMVSRDIPLQWRMVFQSVADRLLAVPKQHHSVRSYVLSISDNGFHVAPKSLVNAGGFPYQRHSSLEPPVEATDSINQPLTGWWCHVLFVDHVRDH